MAICEEKHSKSLIVTKGDLTLEVLQNFVDYSMDFFRIKMLPKRIRSDKYTPYLKIIVFMTEKNETRLFYTE